MDIRKLAFLAIGLFYFCVTAGILTVGLPLVIPFSFIVTGLLCWGFNLYAGLAWILVVHVVMPAFLVLFKLGPLYVVPQEFQPAIMIMMTSSTIAETAFAFIIVRLRNTNEQLQRYQATLLDTNEQLQIALDEVKELRGYLPICAWCKDIRDVSGNWEKLETYLSRHSKATFTHCLCPKCLQEQLRNVASVK